MSRQQREPADHNARTATTGPSARNADDVDGPVNSAETTAEFTGEPTAGSALPTPADAFDLLHDRNAPALLRQTFMLCGNRRLARRAVAHAFRLAWHRWPQVAVDADPAGWVRAAAHQYALAPWRHFGLLRLLRRTRALRLVPPRDRSLLDAMLRLPRPYRAALLLRDGLGLSIGDTAAELEAGTDATAGRLRHARAALAERVPELRDAPPEALRPLTALLVRQLAAAQPAPLPRARRVRGRSEIRTWCGTAAALGLTAAVAAAAIALVATDDERNVPPLPVPKQPSATLPPERQPSRLQPMAAAPAVPGLPENAAGPAPCGYQEAGPFVRA